MPIHHRGPRHGITNYGHRPRFVLVDWIPIRLLYVLFEHLQFGHGKYRPWCNARMFRRRSETCTGNVTNVICTTIIICWIFRLDRFDAIMVKLGTMDVPPDVFRMDRIIGRIR